MEWRYGLAAHKVIALDAGHVGQNLYLACEAVGCGTCAIAAYDQEAMDHLLRIDGLDEFVIYLATVGKYRERLIDMLPEFVITSANVCQMAVPVIALSAYLPQWVQLVRTRSSRDISLRSWCIWTLSSFLACSTPSFNSC